MSETLVLFRLMVACACGGLIGLQSEMRQRPGGFRVHALASMGAAMFCLTGIYFTGNDPRESMRVVQGVASGVGFIGAATVLRQSGVVYGVGTAASIWIAAAIGAFSAFGGWQIAVPAACVVAVLNATTLYAQKRWSMKRRERAPTSSRG